MTTECSYPGCDRAKHSHGLCRAHVGQWRKGATLRPIGTPRTQKTCTFPGCDLPHKSGGWCSPHYSQAFVGAAMHPVGERKPRKVCGFEGCGKPHYGKGWCAAHYHQVLAGGEPKPLRVRTTPNPDATCRFEECGRPVHGNGWCSVHGNQMYRTGEVWPIGSRKPAPREPKVTVRKVSAVKQRTPRPKSTLPAGWDRKARPTQTVAIAGGVKEVGPVKPTAKPLIAAALAKLAEKDALDLADMLGLVA